MKEIGGYLELEHFCGEEFYSEAIAVNNARNALLYILLARTVRKVWIPYYLCDSVRKMLIRRGIEFGEYHIDAGFLPVFGKELEKDEYLYIVNYFGLISPEQEKQLADRFRNVIFDHVQAFFQRPLPGVDTVYSCRKFFGVPDGGYAVTNARLLNPLTQDKSADRFRHLLGRFESTTAGEFYEDFKQNDHAFLNSDLMTMSELTHNLLRAIDYDQIRRQREGNYRVLNDALGTLNPLRLSSPMGPYMYPFYCENGLQLKKKLAQKGIFVPTLWPNVLEQGNKLEQDYASNVLPLPCDQRYGSEDMLHIVSELLDISIDYHQGYEAKA